MHQLAWDDAQGKVGFVVPAAVCREAQYPQSGADSLPRDGDSPQSSPQLAGDSPQFGDGSPQSDRLTGLSDEVLALLPLAEPARRNKKLPVQQLRDIIQRLCVSRWLSASEIAGLVVRDAEKLQARLLTAMVNAGLLELRHPTVRNRPDQAYRTVSAAVPSE